MRLTRALVCLGALAFSIPAFGQDWKGMGRLAGKVLDPDGKPLANVTIKMDLPGRGGTQVKTDKKGAWAILGLASGNWNIDFEADGYVTKRITASVMQEVRGAPLEIKLEKAAAKGPPPEVMEAIARGDKAYQAGQFAEARAEYEKLLVLRPDLAPTLHMQIARCYSQEKNYAKELEHLQPLLDADPSNATLRKLMALEALNGGLLDKGLELMKGLDDAAIQDPDVLYNIAVAFYNNQKVDEAIDYLTKAVSLKPDYADGYFLRGNAYLGKNKLAEAKADYRKFLEVAPSDPRADTIKKVLEQLK